MTMKKVSFSLRSPFNDDGVNLASGIVMEAVIPMRIKTVSGKRKTSTFSKYTNYTIIYDFIADVALPIE